MSSSSNKEEVPCFTVYFDAYCNLCNSWVDRILRKETGARFHFAPLSGEHARKELPEKFLEKLDDPEAIVLQEEGKDRFWSGSEAALKILCYLKWPYRPLAWASIFPTCFNEPFYRWVARNRYRWFGKRETCRLPSPEERERFYS